MHSQNEEEKFILDFFNGNLKGTLLDIGANDGKTFSNSLALIEKGWDAILVEPSKYAFSKLMDLHKDRTTSKIKGINCAIATLNGQFILHESGPHLKDSSDFALLSTLKTDETIRWKEQGVHFTEELTDAITYEELEKLTGKLQYDFITIDCEGLDYDVLCQIDLSSTKLLCIEFNSDEQKKKQILNYCEKFGMTKIIYQSGENLILSKL